ncbi:uncharacterized protein [Littorina saxatilis]|uniref:uncharacterized protein n=1 Tax=Littorina saxatilis TaxID=31220 RepID=UPI0038B5EDC4
MCIVILSSALIRRRTERKDIVLLLHFTVAMHWVTVTVVMWWLSQLDARQSFSTDDDDDCEDNVPEDCYFRSNFCGWLEHNWTRYTPGKYAVLENRKSSGYIKSKVRCVSSPISHCLKFRFYLEKSYENTLNVSIMWPRNKTELLLWTYSTNTRWINAAVPVVTESSFALIIRGRRQNVRTNTQIGVDGIKYERHGCTLIPSPDGVKCENDVPKDCYFGSDFCGWKEKNWTRHTNAKYAFLDDGKPSGHITSKVRCVKTPSSHCLKFKFYLQTNIESTLDVSIAWPHNKSESLLWTYSTKASWKDAAVPVESESNFALIIRARSQQSSGNRHMRVDNIGYKMNKNRCTVIPHSAKPPGATTTELPTTSARPTSKMTTTTTSVTTATTTTREISTNRPTHFTTPVPTTSPATGKSVNSSALNRSTDDVTAETTGKIVGVVVAVIVVAVIATIVFLVLRRKHTPLLAMCSTKTKTNTQQIGSHNKAFYSEEQQYPEINSHSKNPTYTNDTADSASRVNSELFNNDYSVIRDVGADDVTSSAFQPMTSLHCKAHVLYSMHQVNRDSNTHVPSTDANPYDVVDDDVCQARVSSQEVEYNNLAIDKSHETGTSSRCLESSNPKSDSSKSANSMVKSIVPEDALYQNTKECSLSHPSNVDNDETKGAEAGKRGRGGDDREIEGDYYNVDKTPATNNDLEEATSVYHILEEDRENCSRPTSTGGVYHVLEPVTASTESGEHATDVYHILEETGAQNPTEKQIPSEDCPKEDPSLSEGGKGDYHMLDFQKGRGGDVAGDSGDEMGQTYSHLNEAGEDTYSELSREKKRKVVDGDYSLVTLD